MDRRLGLVDWLFRNRGTGRITIVQFPNAALGLFLAATILQRAVDVTGQVEAVLKGLAAGGLIWWALAELTRGVNPWRRLLGGTVLAGQIAAWVS